MDFTVFTYVDTPAGLLDLLSAHLPFSLPLFRRLQFTKLEGGLAPTSRIVFASDSGKEPRNAASNGMMHFSAAYIDPAAGPETQMWVYSTLEDDYLSSEGAEVAKGLVASVVNRARSIGRDYEGDLAYPGGLLVGTLHASVRQAMGEAAISFSLRSTYGYDKWLFRVDELPDGHFDLPEGMYWSTATRADCEVVISRNDLPRQADTLSRLPSKVIKLSDGTPIAWAFLGLDGSLTSLHCEEPYRGRGFAKAVAAQLFGSQEERFGSDGWCSADVSPDNEGSIAVCKSLNGKRTWHIDWVMLHV